VNLTGGAQLAVTEGEGVIAGQRKLKVETAFGYYAKALQAGMGRAHARARPAVQSWASTGEARPGGPNSEEKLFSNKIGFLNLPRLWKFVEGDLGGILT
jgi:hypothetical protein